MMEIRKLPAAAGAEWLLEAFRLLRKSPLGFGVLGLIYAGLWLIAAVIAASAPAIAGPLQFVFFIVGALLVALMIYAAQEVDAGRSATLGALLGSMQGGNGARMFRALIPQAIFAVAMMAAILLLVGQEHMQNAMKAMVDLQAKAQAGIQITPEELMQESIVRLMLGGLVVLALSVIVFMLTITLLPDMLLAGRSLRQALRRSVAASLRNLLAVIVYLALGFVVMMAVSIGVGIALGVLQLILGQTAAIVGNALLYGFFMCVLAGTMYFAWKQMLGEDAGDAAAPPARTGVAM